MSSDDDADNAPRPTVPVLSPEEAMRYTNLLGKFTPECLLDGKPLFPRHRKATNCDELFLFAMCLKVPIEEKNRFLGHYDNFGGALKGLKSGMQTVIDLIPNFNFFDVILPALQEAVLELQTAFGPRSLLPILPQNENTSITLTRSQIFILNAAAFLGMVGEPQNARCGDFNWLTVFVATSRTAGARVACQLAYFHKVVVELGGLAGLRRAEAPAVIEAAKMQDAPPRAVDVTFRRVSRGAGEGPFPVWADLDGAVLLDPQVNRVVVTDAMRIEDFVAADAHVDFANEQIHIGKIIASATQEEALFSFRPELFPALILFETLLPHEVVLIHGARKVVEYTGYGESFRFAHLSPDPLPHELEHIPIVVVMDAHVNRGMQFSRAMSDRDLNKAFAGFAFLKPGEPHLPESEAGCEATVAWPLVATGGWGCGAFGGNQVLKFCQQLMAARAAKARLLYSTFGSADRCHLLNSIAFKLMQHRVTVAGMHALIHEFSEVERIVNSRQGRRQRGGGKGASTSDDDQDVVDFELFLLEKLQRRPAHLDGQAAVDGEEEQ